MHRGLSGHGYRHRSHNYHDGRAALCCLWLLYVWMGEGDACPKSAD